MTGELTIGWVSELAGTQYCWVANAQIKFDKVGLSATTLSIFTYVSHTQSKSPQRNLAGGTALPQ